MFGIPADSYSGHAEDFYRTVHPEDRELVRESRCRRQTEPKTLYRRISRCPRRRTVRWVTATGKFYYAHNGDPERMLGMAVDITDRKLAEEAVRESEERFRFSCRYGSKS